MIAAMALVGAAGIVYNLVSMREAAVEGDAPKRERAVADPVQLEAAAVRAGRRADARDHGQPRLGVPVHVGVRHRRPGLLRLGRRLGLEGRCREAHRGTRPTSSRSSTHRASTGWTTQDFRAITEFPMFSFLLGDMHPHVMALPFVLLVVALALTLFRSREPLDVTFWLQRPRGAGRRGDPGRRAGVPQHVGHRDAGIPRRRGGVRQQLHARAGDHRSISSCRRSSFALPLLILAIVLYLPFYTSFTSQADGIGAVVSNSGITVPATRPFHLLLFWGPLFVVVIPFVLARLLPMRARVTRDDGRDRGGAGGAGRVRMGAALRVREGARQRQARRRRPATCSSRSATAARRGSRRSFSARCSPTALLALWLELTSNDGASAV